MADVNNAIAEAEQRYNPSYRMPRCALRLLGLRTHFRL